MMKVDESPSSRSRGALMRWHRRQQRTLIQLVPWAKQSFAPAGIRACGRASPTPTAQPAEQYGAAARSAWSKSPRWRGATASGSRAGACRSWRYGVRPGNEYCSSRRAPRLWSGGKAMRQCDRAGPHLLDSDSRIGLISEASRGHRVKITCACRWIRNGRRSNTSTRDTNPWLPRDLPRARASHH